VRLKVFIAVVGVAALMSGPSAHARTHARDAGSSDGGRVSLSARVASCLTGADPDSRAAAFTGSMPALSGTRRMQMRFQLWQRSGSSTKARFRKVSVPGWSGWVTSDPGRDGFVFTKRVEALSAPAGYRATVTFRWLDARGHAQKTLSRTTPVCEEPDPRADLVLASLSATPVGGSAGGQAAYAITVENDGLTEADPFAVTLTIGGQVSNPLTLGPIAPGAQATASLAAPRCAPGSTITVTLDVAGTVDESNESDDVVQRSCPLA
jgi:CARDB